MNIAIIGAGAWGTALSNLLSHNNHDVTLWTHEREVVADINKNRRNEKYLPGIDLYPEIIAETDLDKAIAGVHCIVMAVPSKVFRQITSRLSAFKEVTVTVTKGIEYDTGLTMSGVLKETMPNTKAAALSGPTLAMEVAKDIPAAIVAASRDARTAEMVQQLFVRPNFRVYTSTDLLGVELGGALKNVVAIGAGICDGLGFGDNTKAALLTRAIVEIRRLGVACGAQAETFAGLSGLGDLAVTCFSKLSRNRTFGERLGRGDHVEEILSYTYTVAEGYPTARAAYKLARELGVETPIIDEVHAVLYEGKSTEEAVRALMSRDAKPEIDE